MALSALGNVTWRHCLKKKNVIKKKVSWLLTAEHKHYKRHCSFLEVNGITIVKLKCFYTYFFGWGKHSGEYTFQAKWNELKQLNQGYIMLLKTYLCACIIYYYISTSPVNIERNYSLKISIQIIHIITNKPSHGEKNSKGLLDDQDPGVNFFLYYLHMKSAYIYAEVMIVFNRKKGYAAHCYLNKVKCITNRMFL